VPQVAYQPPAAVHTLEQVAAPLTCPRIIADYMSAAAAPHSAPVGRAGQRPPLPAAGLGQRQPAADPSTSAPSGSNSGGCGGQVTLARLKPAAPAWARHDREGFSKSRR
jgi:hypothetical protein